MYWELMIVSIKPRVALKVSEFLNFSEKNNSIRADSGIWFPSTFGIPVIGSGSHAAVVQL